MDVDDEAARVGSSVPVGLSSKREDGSWVPTDVSPERTDAPLDRAGVLSALADASPLRPASSVP
jgi:hypothetical protein